QSFLTQPLVGPESFCGNEGRIRFACVVQAQVIACPVVQVMQKPAKIHHGLLVLWLQWQREDGNRLANAKGIEDRIGPAVTSAHQDVVLTGAAATPQREGLAPSREANFYQAGPGRPDVHPLALIDPAPA